MTRERREPARAVRADVTPSEKRTDAMRSIKTFLLGLASAAIWPTYLGLFAYAARQAPWPRSFAIAGASVLLCLALAAFVAGLARGLLRAGGWAETILLVPATVTRQLRVALLVLVASGVLFLVPTMLLGFGLIAPAGRPVSAPALCQFLVLGFEVTVWGAAFRVLRSRSPMVQWMTSHQDELGQLGRFRAMATGSVLAAIAAVI